MSGARIEAGFREEHRGAVAAGFWEAFSSKLALTLAPEAKALAFISSVLDPQFALSAVSPSGAFLGVAGFKTEAGAFVGGTWSDLSQAYGIFGAAWRTPLLALLERPVAADVLLMDGIFVAPQARGQGVGTLLLDAVEDEARRRALSAVRLDVIDSNPRARALYERRGFVAQGTEDIGPLRHLFGFRSATAMIKSLGNAV